MLADSAPRIAQLEWGRIDVTSYGPFKDVKLAPGLCREWDWRETGTHHQPGIQPADVMELLERGVTVVILSRGQWRMLGVCPGTLQLLEELGIETHVLETRAAVARYNALRETAAVGGLFHSTC
jgi:hypothetical protein